MAKEKEFRNPLLQIRISPELELRLNRVADMYGVTKGEISRMVIGQYVGQVLGTMDTMAEKLSTKAVQEFDMEKMLSVMMPMMMKMEGGLDEKSKIEQANRLSGIIAKGEDAPR